MEGRLKRCLPCWCCRFFGVLPVKWNGFFGMDDDAADNAPDVDVDGVCYVDGFVFCIFGLQPAAGAFFHETFDGEVAVHGSQDNVAGLGGKRSIDDKVCVWGDECADHAIAFAFDNEGAVWVGNEKVVEVDTVCHLRCYFYKANVTKILSSGGFGAERNL